MRPFSRMRSAISFMSVGSYFGPFYWVERAVRDLVCPLGKARAGPKQVVSGGKTPSR